MKKTLLNMLAIVAVASAAIACGPSVTGDPEKDAKTFLELAENDKEKAEDFAEKIKETYGENSEKLGEFALLTLGGAMEKGLDIFE